MSRDVVDGDYFFTVRVRQAPGELDADQQCDGEPRPLRDGDEVNIFHFHMRLFHRFLKNDRQVFHMLPSGKRRHHAAVGRMDFYLRRYDA